MAHLDVHRSAATAPQAVLDTDTLVRSILFVGAFLAVWISFHPFQSLAEPPPAVKEGGDLVNQVAFSSLFLGLAAWTWFHQPQRLLFVMRPLFVVLLLWIALTCLTSWEPGLATRRFVFALILLGISAMVLLVPKNVRQFSDLMAAVVLIVLAVCYLGVMLVPQLAVHQATDFLEPEHAGNWRGVFPHKNQAGAVMVMITFIGLFVMRTRSLALGGVITALALIFLGFSQSKTAIAVMPLVFILSAIISHSRRPAIGIGLVVVILAAFNLFSVGTVIFEPVHRLVALVMPDATFTGRTDIWELGVQAVARRPITGYGFSSFFGTDQVVYSLGENTTWANAATDAHNAYLNLALTIGLPGLLLTILWIVVLPILDFYRLPTDAAAAPLQLLFLRICLYGIYSSCFESSIFQQIGEVWFFYVISAFGLRYATLMRTRA
ncbi:MAG TPA: O-antigen ligase [Xanthobacteraceae bacterium]|nr:O-antigen ligase [Xanthobacteraceae bacterium]